jgi:pyrrolysine biosynthesis protein PylC
LGEDWVVQEYLEGPSYSLEVISREGQCVTLQTTELEMDNSYDCKRVLASGELPESLDRELRRMATILAEALQLTGIMDIEVILNRDRLNILEIDARLPSQTPTAVEMSTGINILELIREVSIESTLPRIPTVDFQRGVVYEHVMVKGDHLEVSGEHIMAGASTLHVEEHFFGADVALTNLVSRDLPWVATLIVSGENRQKAWMRRCGVIEAIMDEFRLSHYADQAPY